MCCHHPWGVIQDPSVYHCLLKEGRDLEVRGLRHDTQDAKPFGQELERNHTAQNDGQELTRSCVKMRSKKDQTAVRKLRGGGNDFGRLWIQGEMCECGWEQQRRPMIAWRR